MKTNREQWLTRAASLLAPALRDAGAEVTVPVRLACGWPSRSPLSRSQRRIGECWVPEASSDGVAEVFVSPLIDDTTQVLGVVAHELIHASGINGHRRDFARVATALDLEGKPTSTVAGEAFKRRFSGVLTKLGDYPHAKMTPGYREKPQGTRLIKAVCPECTPPYIVRLSQATINRGLPICGDCQTYALEVQ